MRSIAVCLECQQLTGELNFGRSQPVVTSLTGGGCGYEAAEASHGLICRYSYLCLITGSLYK